MCSAKTTKARHIGHGHGRDVFAGQGAEALEGLKEGEGGDPLHVGEQGEVDDLQRVVAGSVADEGEAKGDDITRRNTDDEGDELRHLLPVDGAEGDDGQGDEGADEAGPDMGIHDIGGGTRVVSMGESVADRVSGQGKTDDGHRGTDDDGGHQLIDPLDAGDLDDQGDHDVDQTGKHRADEQTGIANLNGRRAAESRELGAAEGDGRTQEHRDFELR
jgi:hypothetical protein